MGEIIFSVLWLAVCPIGGHNGDYMMYDNHNVLKKDLHHEVVVCGEKLLLECNRHHIALFATPAVIEQVGEFIVHSPSGGNPRFVYKTISTTNCME